jgi:hypothetical protein
MLDLVLILAAVSVGLVCKRILIMLERDEGRRRRKLATPPTMRPATRWWWRASRARPMRASTAPRPASCTWRSPVPTPTRSTSRV